MPPLNWPIKAFQVIQGFETRHQSPDGGALFAWAVWAVDSLYYLDDLDRVYDSSRKPIGGHDPAVVDVAHARWATSTCITALDLCAAGLGRTFCGHRGTRELNLAAFDPKSCHSTALRSRLPAGALKWIDAVRSDPGYTKIKKARHWLTHSRLRRHFKLSNTGPSRLELQIGKSRLGIRPLIELARDVARRRVIKFLAELQTL